MPEKSLQIIGSLQFAAIGINQKILPVFLGLLLASAVAWSFISNRLYVLLRQNYPLLYEALGRPKLFMRKSFSVNFKVVRFLLWQDYLTTRDPAVIRLCQGLRSLFFIYLICLAGCLVILLDKLG